LHYQTATRASSFIQPPAMPGFPALREIQPSP